MEREVPVCRRHTGATPPFARASAQISFPACTTSRTSPSRANPPGWTPYHYPFPHPSPVPDEARASLCNVNPSPLGEDLGSTIFSGAPSGTDSSSPPPGPSAFYLCVPARTQAKENRVLDQGSRLYLV